MGEGMVEAMSATTQTGETRTYRVVVTREGGQWLADVEGVPGAHTYARALPTLLRYVREMIVLGEDLPDDAADNLALELDVHTGDVDVDELAAHVRLLRAAVRSSTYELQEQTATTARRLVAAGWSVRDAATVLDIAPQRVSQLTSSGA